MLGIDSMIGMVRSGRNVAIRSSQARAGRPREVVSAALARADGELADHRTSGRADNVTSYNSPNLHDIDAGSEPFCMTDPLRFDRPAAGDADGRERDARIEELLLVGLDHYFAGRHELAINIWTRVLFLDRSHGKARAYIERARGALAEKQRHAEELIHTGQAALDRGDHGAARRLLASAEMAGGGDEALSLLHRLDRLAAAAPATRPLAAAAEEHVHADERATRDARVAWVFAGIATGVCLAAVLGGYLWLVADPFELSVARTGVPVARVQPLPMPSGAEIRLARARRLFAQGELRAALALLEAAEVDERYAASVNELRTTIQQQLIDAGRRRAGFPAAGTDAPQRAKAPGPPR
jgi:hypothetical protein